MHRYQRLLFLLITVLSVISFYSCRKENQLSKDQKYKLEFSVDTLLFDTVFVTKGSITKRFTVRNPNKYKLNITSIKLARLAGDDFKINVDGVPGDARNIEIGANDSLYIFVEVSVDPVLGNQPLVINDNITFVTNNNTQYVNLAAWGQNAHYINADQFIEGLPPFSVIPCDTTWTDNVPHVIFGYAVVDSACTLTIKEGAQIYFHKGGGLWVYKGGQLLVQGTKSKPVVFQGDRLGAEYSDVANQWDRIWINESTENSSIEYAVIKNAFIGIQAETVAGSYGNRLTINNTEIKNMAGVGLFTRFYNISMNNSLVTNCGAYTLAITLGGKLNFKHCTFADYWSEEVRKHPSILINNYNSLQSLPMDSCYFGNCILYGDIENELSFDVSTGATANYFFDHCVLKLDDATTISDPLHYSSCYKNEFPGFVDANAYNYKLTSDAFARNKGRADIIGVFTNDLIGNARNDGAPDLGCFEYAP